MIGTKEIYQAASIEDLFHATMANFQDARYSFGPIDSKVAQKISDFFK